MRRNRHCAIWSRVTSDDEHFIAKPGLSYRLLARAAQQGVVYTYFCMKALHLDAVLKALRFNGATTHELEAVPAADWPALLDAMDHSHLTLALGARCRGSLPELARARIDRNLADNALRHDRLVAAQCQITDALGLHGIKFVVLKGLSQWPYYSDDPRQRPQYDIDLYVPDESISSAAKMMRQLGYQAVSDSPDPGADHLPVMIRKTGWTWRGDFHDPEMPPSLELHHRFWNPRMMRFDVGDVEQFWRRRAMRKVGGLQFPGLDPVDGLSYSALHLVRHLLGGDLQPRHVYEIAHFLDRSAGDDSFWSHWRRTGLQSCRTVEGIAFRLAVEYFQCSIHAAAREAVDQLPKPIQRWFSVFASPPVQAIDQPDKNELWLHFSLLNSWKDRFAVAGRRLFPTRRARVVRDAHLPREKEDATLEMQRTAYETSFMAGRALHHFRAFAPTIRGAYLWYTTRRDA
jgi:hypothetical protein